MKTHAQIIHRIIFSLTAVIMMFFFQGCLTFEETLEFARNGELIVTLRYDIPGAHLPLMRSVPMLRPLFSRADAVAYFDSFKADMEITQYKFYEQDAHHHIEIILLCNDAQKALASGAFGKITLAQSESDGKTDFSMELPEIENVSSWNDAQKTALREQARGFSARLTIIAPGELVESNAPQTGIFNATWLINLDGAGKPGDLLSPLSKAFTAKW